MSSYTVFVLIVEAVLLHRISLLSLLGASSPGTAGCPWKREARWGSTAAAVMLHYVSHPTILQV